MGVNRFQKSTFMSKTTYRCMCCGKLTRETGDGESCCELCRKCFWEAGYENAIQDGMFKCTCGNIDEFTLDGDKEVCTCNVCGRTGLYDKWE